jgi:TPR repeat protein
MSEAPAAQNDPKATEAELEAVVARYRSGDEAGAAPRFERLAEVGSAAAMTWVGYIYLKGRGVPVDMVAAFTWFARAAKASDAEAMCWLGHIYFYGDGVDVDYSTAREWYLKAAEAGDADAMSRIGQMYFYGNGVGVDNAIAYQWYSKAAAAGDDNGQHCFASVLAEAGEQDEAERWLRKAAEQGYEPSINSLRERTAHRMLKEERFREALPLLEQAVSAGSAWSHDWLGHMYGAGRGVRKNPEKSIRHYEIAYEGGRHSANNIGRAHFKAERAEAALDWFRKEAYYPSSSLYWQYRVLEAYPHLQQHPGEADELLVKAADAGHVYAKRAIALRMIKGDKSFGTRLQGLRAWLHVMRHGLRLIMNDIYDERLY